VGDYVFLIDRLTLLAAFKSAKALKKAANERNNTNCALALRLATGKSQTGYRLH
jgi:hypothetical protein